MFHRGAHSKRYGGGIKPRKFKKRNPVPQPEWDHTTQDLTIHAASPEEIQRRRIVHKSKNADAARRELKAKKAGIPPSLMVSPAKLQLEMKKLSLLRNVLYDQNDFTEVLRRADKTMTSVKGALHEKNYTNAYPHVTVAPGYKEQHPMKFAEQPSRLDALSESVMDGTALNEQAYEEDSDEEYEECQFQSKLNCDHFLSILKDAMDNNTLPLNHTDSTKFKTPEANRHISALNGTEQVKRIQSVVNHQPQQVPSQRSIEIGNLITAIAQDASKVKRKLDVSATQLPHHHQPPSSSVQLSTTNGSMTSSLPSTIAPPPPRANISKCSMTYDDLQDAMKKVEKDMSVFDERRGMGNKSATDDSMSFGGGLAGFTKTLLDAITRLIGYVNEGELKHQETCKSFNDVWKKLNHVTAITDALTTELKNEKVRSSVQQEEIDSLKQMIERDRSDHAKLIAQLREDVNSLKSNLNEMKSKPTPSVNDAVVSDGEELVRVDLQGGGDAFIDEPEMAVIKPKEPMIDPLLKNDMLSLLSALKSQNYQSEAKVEKEPSVSSSSEKAPHTISSVENQLSNLRRQHDEAEKRMKDLIKLTDIPVSNASSNNTTPLKDLPPQSSTHEIDFDVSALLGSESSHQTSLLSNDTSSTMTPLKGGVYCDASPPVIPIVKVKRQTNLTGYFDPDVSGDASLTNGKSGDKQAPSTGGLSPLNTIRKDQLSLEDRIAELNRQHSEAQTRLHHLRRHNVKVKADKNQQQKQVQVSIPNPQTLETPK